MSGTHATRGKGGTLRQDAPMRVNPPGSSLTSKPAGRPAASAKRVGGSASNSLSLGDVNFEPARCNRGRGGGGGGWGGGGGGGWDCYVQVSGSVICFGFQDNAKHRDNV